MDLELVLAVLVGGFFHSAAIFAVAYFTLKPFIAEAKRSVWASLAAIAIYGGFILWQLIEDGCQVSEASVVPLALISALYVVMTCLWGWRTYESDRREVEIKDA